MTKSFLKIGILLTALQKLVLFLNKNDLLIEKSAITFLP